ncbi:MAG: hypothetical protein ACHQ51_05940, partial [Elusimicrobiota bacterium]
MEKRRSRRPAAAWLASWFIVSVVAPVFAQPRVIAPVGDVSAPVTPVVGPAVTAANGAAAAMVIPLSVSAPAVPSAPAAVSAEAPASLGVEAVVPAAVTRLMPAPAANAAAQPANVPRVSAVLPVVPGVVIRSASANERYDAEVSPNVAAAPDVSADASAAIIRGGVAAWGPSRSPEAFVDSAVSGEASEGPRSLDRSGTSSRAERPAPPSAPSPDSSRARPRAARAA